MTATHDARRRRNGQYAKWAACDGCGKPVSDREDRHFTDDEVCQGSDGPGFWLCDRKRCDARIARAQAGCSGTEAVEARRRLYERQRAENEAALAEERNPVSVPV